MVKKDIDWEKMASLMGMLVGCISWGVIKGLDRLPGLMETVVFVVLYELVGLALVFSIIWYFEETFIHPVRSKRLNAFFNGLVVTFATFDVALALLTHTSPV